MCVCVCIRVEKPKTICEWRAADKAHEKSAKRKNGSIHVQHAGDWIIASTPDCVHVALLRFWLRVVYTARCDFSGLQETIYFTRPPTYTLLLVNVALIVCSRTALFFFIQKLSIKKKLSTFKTSVKLYYCVYEKFAIEYIPELNRLRRIIVREIQKKNHARIQTKRRSESNKGEREQGLSLAFFASEREREQVKVEKLRDTYWPRGQITSRACF